MKNRKQPFGYRVEMGVVVLHPQEAMLVKYIFQQYISGASYKQLVTVLREQPIPYDEGKLWNKNMVARILEDHRYAGESGYPAITTPETLDRVRAKRSSKQSPVQKTEAQKLLRQLSGHTATERMEQQVLAFLNSLIASPERIASSQMEYSLQTHQQEIQRELDDVMNQLPVDEDAAKKLILTNAAAQYATIPDEMYETVRRRRIFSAHEPMSELPATLLQASVTTILCHRDGTLDIQLKNHQRIGRSETA